MGARRLVLLLLAAAVASALVIAGCGSSASSSASSPIATELSYIPAGSPYVVTIATDPNSSAIQGLQNLIGKFPLAGLGIQELQSKLTQFGLDYSSDIKPLLGNPVVIAFASSAAPTTANATSPPIVAAWIVKSASTLKSLLKKSGVSAAGNRDGATLYNAGGAEIAVDGTTVVVGTRDDLTAALDRHAHGGGFSVTDYEHDSSGLPQSALFEAFGSLNSVLAQPSAATARRVPWVAAIRSYGAAVTASSEGLSIDFRVDTSGGKLSAAQLPIAAGSTAPAPAGPAPIEVAIHDPSQIVTFAENVAQAVDPSGYQRFLGNEATERSKLGIDLPGLTKLLTGDMSVASNTQITAVRAAVSNPAKVAQTLAKIAHAPRSIIHKPVVPVGGGFYAIDEGTFTLTLGVAGNQLLVGRATPAQLRAFAAAKTNPVAGAQGSVAFRIGLIELVELALHQAPPTIVQPILSSIGDLTGSVAATPDALTGHATLAVK